jgi:hypothetical protein
MTGEGSPVPHAQVFQAATRVQPRPHPTMSPAAAEGLGGLRPEMHCTQQRPETQGPELHPGAKHTNSGKGSPHLSVVASSQ